jgi:hypothetical protein
MKRGKGGGRGEEAAERVGRKVEHLQHNRFLKLT